MKMTKVFGIAALATIACATTARADVKQFLTRCSPGSIRTCASLQVTTTPKVGGGTDVIIRVRNLAGQLANDNTGGSLITRIGLVAPYITGASGLTVSAGNGAQNIGGAATKWTMSAPGGLGTPIYMTAGIQTGTQAGGIAGCNGSWNLPATRFVTCASTSWVAFRFSTTNNWSANNSEVAWLANNFNANQGGLGVECGSNDSHGARQYCTNVTPEPVTMILLGSGLAGMSGFGVLRRRKKDEIV